MSEEVKRHLVKHVSEFKLKLIRGQRGGYGWEITYNHPSSEEILEKIRELDKTLREWFEEPKDVKGANDKQR
jgi:hypothetical protein